MSIEGAPATVLFILTNFESASLLALWFSAAWCTEGRHARQVLRASAGWKPAPQCRLSLFQVVMGVPRLQRRELWREASFAL